MCGIRVYSHRALALPLAFPLLATLGRNTLISVAPFSPNVTTRVAASDNASVKSQMDPRSIPSSKTNGNANVRCEYGLSDLFPGRIKSKT